MVDSLIFEDVDASTIHTLMVIIAANLIQLSTDSPQLIYQGVPCHALLECLDFPWWVESECILFPYYLSESSDSSLSESGLAAVLKTDNCLFWLLNFFSIIGIMDLHFPCQLFLPHTDLECPTYLEVFLPPFIPLRALRTLSLSLLLSAYHSFES